MGIIDEPCFVTEGNSQDLFHNISVPTLLAKYYDILEVCTECSNTLFTIKFRCACNINKYLFRIKVV